MGAQMPQRRGGKGNPAAHRMGNPARKVARSLSYQRGQKRKEERRAEQRRRERVNRDRGFTGWEEASASRAARRHAAS